MRVALFVYRGISMKSVSLSELSAYTKMTLSKFDRQLEGGEKFDHAASALDELCNRLAGDTRAGAQRLLQQVERHRLSMRSELARVDELYDAMYAAAGMDVDVQVAGAHVETCVPSKELDSQNIIVGIDEVGRGPLAGPLTVAAVVLPPKPRILYLNDSKKLSAQRRELVALRIVEHASALGISHIEPHVIDEIGIVNALRMGMRRAVDQLNLSSQPVVLIDGNPIHAFTSERCIVQGDARIASIAAASIVAKVARDALMVEYDEQYPGYGFAASKGYGSAAHIAAIKELGLSPIHRRSFCRSCCSS